MNMNASQGSQDLQSVDAVPAPSPFAGPWFVVEHPDGERPRYWVVQNPDTWVERVCAVPDYLDAGLANATQIAASPDMVEALRPIAWIAAQHPDAGTFDTQMISTKLLRDAAAAYLKATGGQP